MDIHAPDKPVHSIKDFAVHIAIVTVGILIALGLDGVRESFREHRLLRETRENFRQDLQISHDHMADEMARVSVGHQKLEALTAELPTLIQQHPEQVAARLEAVKNPNYFFSTNAWQAALSTGAVAHMATDEVTNYAWAAEGTKIYVSLQQRTMDSEVRAIAFWQAHPHPTADQAGEGTERILIFARDEESLAYVAPQTMNGFNHALASASR